MREVLQVAPDDLDRRVQQVMQAFVAERGYLGFTSHVAKMGRMRFIEIHVLADPATPLGSVGRSMRCATRSPCGWTRGAARSG